MSREGEASLMTANRLMEKVKCDAAARDSAAAAGQENYCCAAGRRGVS